MVCCVDFLCFPNCRISTKLSTFRPASLRHCFELSTWDEPAPGFFWIQIRIRRLDPDPSRIFHPDSQPWQRQSYSGAVIFLADSTLCFPICSLVDRSMSQKKSIPEYEKGVLYIYMYMFFCYLFNTYKNLNFLYGLTLSYRQN